MSDKKKIIYIGDMESEFSLSLQADFELTPSTANGSADLAVLEPGVRWKMTMLDLTSCRSPKDLPQATCRLVPRCTASA